MRLFGIVNFTIKKKYVYEYDLITEIRLCIKLFTFLLFIHYLFFFNNFLGQQNMLKLF